MASHNNPDDVKSASTSSDAGTGAPQKVRLFHASPHLFDRPSSDKVGNGLASNEYGWGFYAGDAQGAGEYTNGYDGSVVYSVDIPVEDFSTRWLHCREPIGQAVYDKLFNEAKKNPTLAEFLAKQNLSPNTEGDIIARVAKGRDMGFPWSPQEGAQLLSRIGIDGYVEGSYAVFYKPEAVPTTPYRGYGKYAEVIEKVPEPPSNIRSLHSLQMSRYIAQQAAPVSPPDLPAITDPHDGTANMKANYKNGKIASEDLDMAVRRLQRNYPSLAEEFKPILDGLHLGPNVGIEVNGGFYTRRAVGVALNNALSGESPANIPEQLGDLRLSDPILYYQIKNFFETKAKAAFIEQARFSHTTPESDVSTPTRLGRTIGYGASGLHGDVSRHDPRNNESGDGLPEENLHKKAVPAPSPFQEVTDPETIAQLEQDHSQPVPAKFERPKTEFHAQWDPKKIAAFIPGMEAALPNQHTFHLDIALKAIDRYCDGLEKRCAQMNMQGRVQTLQTQPTPANFHAFLKDMTFVTAHNKNLTAFAPMLAYYMGAELDATQYQTLADHVTQRALRLPDPLQLVSPALQQLSAEQKQHLLSAPELAEYAPTLRNLFSTPLRDPNISREELLQAHQQHTEASTAHRTTLISLDYEKEAPLAHEALAKMIQSKIQASAAAAQINGFKDTYAYAHYGLGIDHHDVDRVTGLWSDAISQEPDLFDMDKGHEDAPVSTQAEEHTPPPAAEQTPPSEHPPTQPAEEKFIEPRTYSVREAKDIARSTLKRIHPSLGKVVDKTFSDGRAQVTDGFQANALTFSGAHDPITLKMQPSLFLNGFDGSTTSLWLTTHELAHVAHGTLAAQHNGAATCTANVNVYENFSHFVELMLHDELLKRAQTPSEKIYADAIRHTLTTNSLALQHVSSFQHELHKIVEIEKADLSFERTNDIYRQTGTKLYGPSWKPADLWMNDWAFVESWNMVSDSHFLPHQMNAYLGNHVAAHAMKALYDKDPKAFGEKFLQAMKSGAHMDYPTLIDHYFGEGAHKSGVVYEQGVAAAIAEQKACRERMQTAREEHKLTGSKVKPVEAPHFGPAPLASGVANLAFGGYGLYQQYTSPTFQQDLAAGGTRAFDAKMGIVGNTTAVGMGGADIAVQAKMMKNVAKGAEAMKGLPTATRYLGPGGIAVALAAGVFEVAAAGEAGDGHRQASVGGHVFGGITGAMAGATTSATVIAFCEGLFATTLAGAEAGALGGPWGIAIGAGAGLLFGIGGAIIGGKSAGAVSDALLGDYLQGKHDAAAVKQMQEMQKALADVTEKSRTDTDWAHYDFKQIDIVQKTRTLLQKRLAAEKSHEQQNPAMIALLQESVNQVNEVATRLHLPAYALTEEQFNKQHYQKIGDNLLANYEKQLDKQITALIPELEKMGWAKELGDKKGPLTLDEIKAAFPKGFDYVKIDANLDGKVTGKEVTDVLNQPAAIQQRKPSVTGEHKGRN